MNRRETRLLRVRVGAIGVAGRDNRRETRLLRVPVGAIGVAGRDGSPRDAAPTLR